MSCVDTSLRASTAVVARSWLQTYHKQYPPKQIEEAQKGTERDGAVVPIPMEDSEENDGQKKVLTIEETIQELTDQYLNSGSKSP